MIILNAVHGLSATAMMLTLVALASFGGCARSSPTTFRLVVDSPIVRIQVLEATDSILFRPTEARVATKRGRHAIQVDYEFIQDAENVIHNQLVERVTSRLYSSDAIQFEVDGNPMQNYQPKRKKPWATGGSPPASSFIISTSIDPAGRTIMTASVPRRNRLVMRGTINAFDLTIDLDIMRTLLAMELGIAEDRVSVVASEPEARWTFVRDRSR